MFIQESLGNSQTKLSTKTYDLAQDSKGLLVICNYTFREEKTPWYRINARQDTEKVQSCFNRLGFEVLIREYQTKERTLSGIQSIMNECLDHKHSLFFFFLSHGENKGRDSYFFTEDKKTVTLPEIWDLLSGAESKIIKDKPKVLILSLSQPDPATMIPKDDSGWFKKIFGSKDKPLKKIEAPSDLATIQAISPNIEVPGIKDGTVFPSCFCDTLLEEGRGKDLHEIVNLTGERLKELEIDSTPTIEFVQFRKFIF